MKSMTCRDLGGACDTVFRADSFEEMGELSKRHAVEMFRKGDTAHLQAAEAMRGMMSEPAAFQEWFEAKRREFEALPDE
jgi:hypothetical protein